MLCKLYAGANEVIQNGSIGNLKMTRIHKNETLDNDNYGHALKTTLYSDIKFLQNRVGSIDEVFAKSVQLKNTIIMIHHDNNCISHIAVNFDSSSNASPVYRVEIVGDAGIIDYDSSRDLGVKSCSALSHVHKTDFTEDELFIKNDNNAVVAKIIDGIFQSIHENKPIALTTNEGGGRH